MSETPLSFEKALLELERVLRDLEDGTATLDEALAGYEKGIALLKLCHEKLGDAEFKIRRLVGLGEDGKPEFRPFEHTASVDKARRPRPHDLENDS